MQLVAYGAQDIYLTGNPQITFFKVVYRRHTNFSMEAIKQTFNGTADYGQDVTATISRNGDLVHRMYVEFDMSAAWTAEGAISSHVGPNIGNTLLSVIELEIGGQRVDKHYSEWLYIWNELSMPKGKKSGYDVMVGGSERNASFRLDKATSVDVYVPLEFWFCRNVGLALPLIALQYHEVKINIDFATKGELEDNNVNNWSFVGNTRNVQPNNHANNTGGALELETAELWVDYIFLDTDERRRFAQLSH